MANRRSDNTLRNAQTLEFDRTVRNFVGQRDRVDFYKFRATSQVDFSLALSDLRSNASVRLLDSRRRLLAASNQSGNQSEEIVATLEAGTYYIQVQSVGRRSNTRYSLRIAAAPAEPGEATATARNLGIFSGEYRAQEFIGTTDSLDYYKFNLPQISTFNANIDGISAQAYMELFFDANNNGLIDNDEKLDDGRDGDNIARTMLAGNYFLKVQPWSSSDSTQYNLLLSASPSPSNIPSDPGDRPDIAFNLGSLSTATVQDFVGRFDGLDYYKFNLPQISNFNANIDGLPDWAYMELFFDANNNGVIDNGEQLDTGRDGDNIARTMLPGNYFLKVQPWGSSSSIRYDLIMSAIPDPGNLPIDPGSRTDTAYNLSNLSGSQTLKDFVGAFDNTDYYRFTLSSTRNFSANVDGLPDWAYMELFFDTNNNGLIDNGERLDTGRDEDNIARVLQAGNYFLSVQPWSSSSSIRYDLTVAVS